MTDRREGEPERRARVKPLTAEIPVDALAQIISALSSATDALDANTTVQSKLIGSLDATDKSNKDTAKWRKRASQIGVLAIALTFAILFQFHRNEQDRTRASDKQEQHDLAQNLGKCQSRNAGDLYARDIATGLVGAIVGLHAPAAITDPLYATIKAAPKDIDCDGDGHLTTADYPPAAVGR